MPGPGIASPHDVVFTDFDHVLRTTRAVRKRLDLERPVEPLGDHRVPRLAAQAPTGGNIQSWRFLVVTDPELRAAIGEYYRRGAGEYLAAGLARARTDEQRRVADSSVYLMENFDRVPVHVLACVKGRPPAGDQNLAGFYGSIMPAVWSFALALRSRGLGSVWTTLHLAYEREVAAAARHTGQRDAGCAAPGRVHDRAGLQAGGAAADRAVHLLEPLRRHRACTELSSGRAGVGALK